MAACSICNDPVLIAALKVALGNAPAPSGNVDSIICNPPLTASTPTGDVTIELPISGTWSATNNVVLGSSATALEWGTDGGTSLVFTDLSLPIVSTYFDTTESIGMRAVLNTGVSTTYFQKGDPSDFPTASVAILSSDVPTLTLDLPLNFPLNTPTFLPIVGTNLNTPSNLVASHAVITGVSPTVASFTILTNNLVMSIGDQIIFYFPSFTLFNGQ